MLIPNASLAYQACLVSPWVFWFDYNLPKYEPWLNQTHLICRRSIQKGMIRYKHQNGQL